MPRGAALQSEILKEPELVDADFAVYMVNRDILAKVANWPRTGPGGPGRWIRHVGRAGAPAIAPGDVINLSIWDSEENSLLTSPGQKEVQMLNLTVSTDGMIFVPYIGDVNVARKTADEARRHIQGQMETIVPAAQVQLAVTSGRGNSVDLVGGVTKPGNYPLAGENFTLLNLVSLGGGIPATLRNPQVRLIRGNRVHSTSISRLYADPGLDTVLQGGDKVIIEEDKRFFMALGAAGNESLIYFEKDRVTALEAMSMIGGITDNRADPQGILVLREYPQSAVHGDEIKGPPKARAVFVIDLTSADGLFSAGKFEIFAGDTVLATESPVTAVESVFAVIGRMFGIASNL
ncbi:MAG: polysaccharide export protein [Rhodobacteraceae bacterium]|nr:polysaccharide export protein [Paracoccaceae bacterium]